MTSASGFHPDIVALTVEILAAVHVAIELPLLGGSLCGGSLPILRVEVEFVGGQGLVVCAVVDIEIEGVGSFRSLVANRDAGVLLKRHGEEAIQSLVRADLQRNRLIEVIVAET